MEYHGLTNDNLIVINKYKDPVDKFYTLLGQALSVGADVLVINDNPQTSLKSDGFEVINHTVNVGISASRNEGIEYALSNGYDTILFLDGDDELGNFNHSSYNTSVALLNEPNSEIVGVIGFRDILGAGEVKHFFFGDVFRGIIFKTQTLKDLSFETDMDLGEDNLFMLDLADGRYPMFWAGAFFNYVYRPRPEGLFAQRDQARLDKLYAKIDQRGYER